jgi:hypothetical protein
MMRDDEDSGLTGTEYSVGNVRPVSRGYPEKNGSGKEGVKNKDKSKASVNHSFDDFDILGSSSSAGPNSSYPRPTNLIHSHPDEEEIRKVMTEQKEEDQGNVPAAPATTALTIFVEYVVCKCTCSWCSWCVG